jgi:predicted membrane channel-forming protein YqfA (hemolysin III family)
MREYIYIYIPVYVGALLVGGTVVLAVSPQKIRRARTWFALAVATLVVLPITYGATSPEPTAIRLLVAGVSGATIGLLLYGLFHSTDGAGKYGD